MGAWFSLRVREMEPSRSDNEKTAQAEESRQADELERLARERTAQLVKANEELLAEIDVCRWAERRRHV
jgi:hypothetical protein